MKMRFCDGKRQQHFIRRMTVSGGVLLMVFFLAKTLGWAAELETVTQWNRLSYDVQDTVIAERWETSEIYGQALIQGRAHPAEGGHGTR